MSQQSQPGTEDLGASWRATGLLCTADFGILDVFSSKQAKVSFCVLLWSCHQKALPCFRVGLPASNNPKESFEGLPSSLCFS